METIIVQQGTKNIAIGVNNGVITIEDRDVKLQSLTSLPAVNSLFFSGREAEMAKLRLALSSASGKYAIQLYGDGGIGKTTVAEHYVYHNRDSYNHIAFIKCEGTVIKSVVNNVQLIDSLKIDKEVAGKSVRKKFELITNRLRHLQGKKLIVLDDATPDFVHKEIQDALLTDDKVELLVTARDPMENCEHIHVGKLEKEAARILFYFHYNFERDDRLVKAILEQVDYHTLTIEVIAKTADARIFTLKETLDIVKKKPQTFREGNNLALRLGEADTEILEATAACYLMFSN